VDDGQFNTEYDYRYPRGTPGAADKDTTVAFVNRTHPDGTVVFIHEDRQNGGTVQHEVTHLASSPDFVSAVGTNLNEAATEYFARQFLVPANVNRNNTQYATDGRVGVIDAMANLVGRDAVRRAYFGTRADMDNLRAAVDRAKGAGTFDLMALAAQAGRYDLAKAGLQK
jgi:hypothetical protein